jgi:hypothetical protein
MRTARTSCIAAILGLALSVAGWAQTYEPYNCEWSFPVKEAGLNYVCPSGKIMVGRAHYGDENGSTQYNCCNVRPVGGTTNVSLFNCAWSGAIKESSGINYICPSDKVMVGRAHFGDENGSTYYQCCNVLDSGLLLLINTATCAWSGGHFESQGLAYTCPYPKVMNGRVHSGDENGITHYRCCELW